MKTGLTGKQRSGRAGGLASAKKRRLAKTPPLNLVDPMMTVANALAPLTLDERERVLEAARILVSAGQALWGVVR